MLNFEQLVDAAKQLDVFGEEPDWDDAFDGLDLMGLLAVVGECREQKRLADLVRRAAAERIVAILGRDAVSDGRVLYRTKPKTDRKVKDPLEFIQWLGPDDAAKVLNLNEAFSIEAFRELCESRGLDTDEMEGHFFSVKLGERELSDIPVDNRRAPAYAKAMVPGEIRRGRQ